MTNLESWFYFIAACFVPALVLSCAVTGLMRKLAPRWGLVDHPASRKVHATPTPMGGGIGIYCGFVIPVIAALVLAWDAADPALEFLPEELRAQLPGALLRAKQLACILGAGTLLAVMGLWDDLRGLPWHWRLAVQLVIALGLTTFADVRGSVFIQSQLVGTTLSVIWIVVLINAFNFLDNMDALSAGIGFIASVLFAVVMLWSQRWLVGGCLLVLAGSLLGFLWHNRPPARIFMGDAGSTFLGLMLACLTLVGTFYEPGMARQHVILAPVCVLAVPLYDFSSVILIRLIRGHSPFHPDKNHFSHRLVELGLSPRYAVMTVHLCTLTTGLGALILYLPDVSDAALVGALVLCIVTIIAILETAGRRSRP